MWLLVYIVSKSEVNFTLHSTIESLKDFSLHLYALDDRGQAGIAHNLSVHSVKSIQGILAYTVVPLL